MSHAKSSRAVFLPAAELQWNDNDTPASAIFQDIYFSKDDGLKESSFVFLEQNDLASRFAAMPQQQTFVIGETGFGTGLNFLLSWQLFNQQAPTSARLVFRSAEAFPLTPEQLQRALSKWPSLDGLARQLVQQWPPPLAGLHTLDFDNGRIRLQLWMGDVHDALLAWQDSNCGLQRDATCAQAWFLDGFAPSRNPDMWREEVINAIGSLSTPETTLATFTVAGSVRRAVQAAGFEIEKRPGYGSKREMLRARFRGPRPAHSGKPVTPWHAAGEPTTSTRTALVIGAGIAGCSTAAALARRGLEVCLVDAADAPAQRGSGNPQAVLFTPVPAADAEAGWVYLHAYLYATRFYRDVAAGDNTVFNGCGVLHQYEDSTIEALDKLKQRYAGQPDFIQFCSREQASQIAARSLNKGAFYLPRSGWLSPQAVCAQLSATPGIEFLPNTEVKALIDTGAGWRAECVGGAIHADVVVIANAYGAATLLPDRQLPIEVLRGQISTLRTDDFGGSPDCVVCGEGYVTPAQGDICHFGASYTRNTADTTISDSEHADNIARMQRLFDDFRANPEQIVGGRAALRCASRDRLPLVGPVTAQPDFDSVYAEVSSNARGLIAEHPPVQPGLFLNIGHGSRGFTTAPFCAEIIAGHIFGEPPMLSWRLQQYLLPARFDIRRLRRVNRTHT